MLVAAAGHCGNRGHFFSYKCLLACDVLLPRVNINVIIISCLRIDAELNKLRHHIQATYKPNCHESSMSRVSNWRGNVSVVLPKLNSSSLSVGFNLRLSY